MKVGVKETLTDNQNGHSSLCLCLTDCYNFNRVGCRRLGNHTTLRIPRLRLRQGLLRKSVLYHINETHTDLHVFFLQSTGPCLLQLWLRYQGSLHL